MKPHTCTLIVLALTACRIEEEGIDRTIIRGNIVVPPAAVSETLVEGVDDNGTWDVAEELPVIHYRKIALAGNAATFGGETFGQQPDVDHYAIGARAGGTLDLTLDFVSGQGMGRDRTIMELYVYDLEGGEEDCQSEFTCACDCTCEATYDEGLGECTVGEECEEECTCKAVETVTCTPIAVAGGSSDGTLGHYSVSIPVEARGVYGIEVIAADSTEYEAGTDYTLSVGALTPDEGSFLVGAYQADDPHAHGDPVGGSSVFDLQWDALNEMWTGKFEILYVKSVVTEVVTDPGDTASHEEYTVDENLDKVWLMGGTLPKLNSTIPSFALYSSAAVEVELTDHDSTIGGWYGWEESWNAVARLFGFDVGDDDAAGDTADTAYEEPTAAPLGAIVVSVDALQPRTIGWEASETEPNDIPLNEDYSLPADQFGVASAMPVATGAGFVDIASGSATLDASTNGWFSQPNDVLALSFDEDAGAAVTLAWDDCSADIDMILYDSDGNYQAWAASSACPEFFDTAAFGVSMPAGSTWYLAILPYSGTPGDYPYTVELEYTSP